MLITWIKVSRYVVYILLLQLLHKLLFLLHRPCKMSLKMFLHETKTHLFVLVIASTIIVYSGDAVVFEDFMLLSLAYMIVKHPEIMTDKKTISYGTGMACNYFESYLANIIPGKDDIGSLGFQEAIRSFKMAKIDLFPVFFIVITKSLYCPGCLTVFNKIGRPDLPYLERAPFPDSFSCVNTRRGFTYRIHRGDSTPVHVAAEPATPLHTIHKVLQKQGLYQQLTEASVSDIVEDFCSQLEQTIARSSECRGKCVLVHYDDLNPNENLADVLLQKIEEIKSEFVNFNINKN